MALAILGRPSVIDHLEDDVGAASQLREAHDLLEGDPLFWHLDLAAVDDDLELLLALPMPCASNERHASMEVDALVRVFAIGSPVVGIVSV